MSVICHRKGKNKKRNPGLLSPQHFRDHPSNLGHVYSKNLGHVYSKNPGHEKITSSLEMLTIFEVEEVEDQPHEGRLHELLELHLARVLLRERTLEHRLEVERVLKMKRRLNLGELHGWLQKYQNTVHGCGYKVNPLVRPIFDWSQKEPATLGYLTQL